VVGIWKHQNNILGEESYDKYKARFFKPSVIEKLTRILPSPAYRIPVPPYSI